VQITNLNPGADIGASSWLVSAEGRSLLLDAGTHPRFEGPASLPLYGKIGQKDVDAIALTHCHLDHAGSLPVALRLHPHARVLMSEPSFHLVERVLHNSANVMQRRAEAERRPDLVLFGHEDVENYAPVFESVPWRTPFPWAAHSGRRSPPYTVELFEAGHVLGAAGTLVTAGRRKLFYTGDVCFHDQTLIKAAKFKDARAEVMIVETTRGAQAAPQGFSRAGEVERLATALRRVQDRRGGVLIPSFALGRTQEILAILAGLMKRGVLRRQPVYIGGLGKVFTEIYDMLGRKNRRSGGGRLSRDLNLVVSSVDDIWRMPTAGRIMVLTAGMITPDTASHAAVARLAESPKNAVFFVGYTDPESPGGRLRAAGKGGSVTWEPDGARLDIKCDVGGFDLTAHAQREATVKWLVDARPKTVVLGHGDAAAKAWFTTTLGRRCPGMKVICPGPGETVDV
jgi:Cft2 family RNA processing exonuclease